MAKKAFFLLFLISTLHVRAQAPVSATFGAGYKTTFGTVGIFMMGVDLTDRIGYHIGPAINIVNSGMGATSGFSWEFIKTRKYSFGLNADYQYLFARNISKLFESDKKFATYRTPSMHHVFASASFNIMMNRVSKSLGDDKFSFNIGYGMGLQKYKPELVAGEANKEILKPIARQISSGIAFSISYTAYLFGN